MSTTDPDLPDAVLDAVRRVHSGLRPSDVDLPDPVVLAEVARGDRPGLTSRERASAVAALARHPYGGHDPETYRRLANDPGVPLEVRTSAVAGLRFLSPERAEAAALGLLDAELERVVSATVGTLSVVGRERAFEALGERFDLDAVEGTLGEPSTFPDVGTGRAAFARAVAGHRARLAEVPRFGVAGVDREGLQGVSVGGTATDFAGSLRERTDGPLFGVEPRDDAVGFGVDLAGSPPMALVLDRVVTDEPTGLADAPSLPGVVLALADETGTYEPDLLAFADPGEEGLDVTVTRVDGRAVYAGRAVPADDGLAVSLTDTGLVGTAPTRLRLHVGPDGATLREGAVDPTGAVTRSPEAWSVE